MNTTLQTDVIETYLGHIAPIADEFTLTYDDEGFQTQVVDPANVAFGALTLPVRNTDSFDANGGGTLGVNRDRLADIVSIAATDSIELTLNTDTRTLETQAGGLSVTMGLIDPDHIRAEPEMPDLAEQWVGEITLPARDLQRACKAVDLVSDHIGLEAESEAECDTAADEVRITGKGDTDSVTHRFDASDVTELDIDADGDADTLTGATSLFSLGYVQSIAKTFGKDVQVTLSFGEDVPCRLVGASESGRVEYIIAPRIES